MTKQEAMNAIIRDCTPEVGTIYILEDLTDRAELHPCFKGIPAHVAASVKNHLTKSSYDSVAKALTGSIYLFKVTKVDQYKYKDWDYNVIRTHTRSIDGELRCMAD